jgi:hypothetical protein
MDFGCLILTLAFSITPGTQAALHGSPGTAPAHVTPSSVVIADECRPVGLEALDEELGVASSDNLFCPPWAWLGDVG